MEIYKDESDVIATFYNNEYVVLEQLATIKKEDKDYFVLIPFIKDKAKIKMDAPIPIIITTGITIGTTKIVRAEKDISIKETVFEIFKQNSKDKYNFPDPKSMTLCYKSIVLFKEIVTVFDAMVVEINELKEKIAIKKAQTLKQEPKEIQKTASEILELTAKQRKKLELVKTVNEFLSLTLKKILAEY